MKIERADKHQVPEIIRLQRACYRENAERYGDETILPMRETEEELQAAFDDLVLLVAIQDETIIGSVRARQLQDTCQIGRLMVDPGHQNRGIGRRLLQEIESTFPRATRFELFTGWKDEKNLNLYAKLGYLLTGREETHQGVRFLFLEKCGGPSSAPA